MAESFLSEISVHIIEKLGDRAIKELGVWWNYKDELEKLEDTIATVQAVLLDAEDEREPSHQFKLWLRKLRNVLYDAEELVDDFSTEVKRRKIMNGNNMAKVVCLFFPRTSYQFVYGHRMGHKIKAVRDALDAIASDRQKFHFTVRSSKALVISKGREDVSSKIGEVLGRDNDKGKIIELLKSDGHMVIPIVGSGGLGKTTLARLIFDDDEQLKRYFDLRMWVSVGDVDFTVDEIAQKAIDSATSKKKDESATSKKKDEADKVNATGKRKDEADKVNATGKRKDEANKVSATGKETGDAVAQKDIEPETSEKKEESATSKKKDDADKVNASGKRKDEAEKVSATGKETGGAIAQDIEPETSEKKEESATGKKKFREIIGRKRFLLILDDVWSEDRNKWLDLENLWKQDHAIGSKVVLTTRNLDVAKMTGNLYPYRLGYLSPEDSKSLFKKVVFGEKKPPNKQVEENVKKIVKKCGGVPLAIKTIANLLFSLDPETEWLPFVTNELSKYPQANNNIFPTLMLSYHHLPSPLKYCFAYCKIFPKGHVIDVETLIQLWIAQGYIRKSNESNQSLEDIGMRYCKVLVARSFFEVGYVDEYGNLESLKMHDIMHELASHIGGEDIVFSNPLGEDVNKYTHHLSYRPRFSRSLRPDELDSLLEAKKLRTFVSISTQDPYEYMGLRFSHQHRIEARECHKMLKKLKSLLVLDLQRSDLEIKIPKFFHSPFKAIATGYIKWAKQDWVLKPLGKLKHLRYLDLSHTHIKKLPKSLTKLQNLQVLKLCGCYKLKKLPKDIRKLVSLRILDCRDCHSLRYMPRGLQYLSSLHTLTMFVVPEGPNPSKHQAGLDDLNKLSLLRKLGIKNLNLTKLSLSRKDSTENALLNLEELRIYYYQGVEFPDWFSNLTNLVVIIFSWVSKCEHLPRLSGLPLLKRIQIYHCTNLRYVEGTRKGGNIFPSLKTLELLRCPKLERWWKMVDNAGDDSTTPQFPCLSDLSISDCPLLTSMPLFPTLDGTLSLGRTSITPLQQTLKMVVPVSTTTTPSSSSSSPRSSLDPPLSGLKRLECREIKDLTSIPEEWRHQLSSLQSLELNRCHALSERCGNKKGADWDKISHIPNIEVDGRTIQKEGRYQLDEQES